MFTEKEKEILKGRLSENMRLLRSKLGISQAKLAEIMGVSRQTINTVENQQQKMTWHLFVSLILFFSYADDTRELLPIIKLDMHEIEHYLLNKK